MQFRLNNFFKRITGPGSAILNLPNEIKDISKILSTTMGGYVNKLMGSLGDYLSEAISKGFDKVATAILAKVAAGFTYPMAIAEIVAIQTGVMPAISKLFDGIKQGEFIDKELAAKYFNLYFETKIEDVIGHNPLPLGGMPFETLRRVQWVFKGEKAPSLPDLPAAWHQGTAGV